MKYWIGFEKFYWYLTPPTHEVSKCIIIPSKSRSYIKEMWTFFVTLSSWHHDSDCQTLIMNLPNFSINWSYPVAFQFVALPYNVSCELLNTRSLELITNYYMLKCKQLFLRFHQLCLAGLKSWKLMIVLKWT